MRYSLKHHLPSLGFLFITFLWGMTFVFIKKGVESVDPFLFNCYRFSLAFLVLLAINPTLLKHINKEIIYKGGILGALLFSTVTCQALGLQKTNASTASFITSTSMVFVVIISSLIDKKLPSWRTMCAICLSLTGITLITRPLLHGFSHSDLLVVCCAMSFGGYLYLASNTHNIKNILAINVVQFLVIASLSATLVYLSHNSFIVSVSHSAWIALVYCAIFASIVAFYLQLLCQKYISSQRAGAIFVMEPVFASLGGVFILHEHLGMLFYLGATLILLSIFSVR